MGKIFFINKWLFCWHGIWPDGLCGVRGLTAPDGLRLRVWGRWLVAPMGRHQPPYRGVRLAPAVMLGIGLRMWYSASPSSFPYIFACLSLSLLFKQSLLYDSQFNISIRTRLISTCSSLLRVFPRGLRYPVPFNKIFTFCATQGTGGASVTRNKLPRAPDPGVLL